MVGYGGCDVETRHPEWEGFSVIIVVRDVMVQVMLLNLRLA